MSGGRMYMFSDGGWTSPCGQIMSALVFYFQAFFRCMQRVSLVSVLIGYAGVAQANWVDADHPHIQYLGRVSFADPKAPAFSWTGVSVRLRFTGPYISVRIRDRSNRYSVVIDGVDRSVLVAREDQEEYILATDLGLGLHELHLVKRHESHWHKAEFLGVQLSEGHSLLPPPPRSELRMEFIGDSYVACYGCEWPQRSGDHEAYLQSTNISVVWAFGGKALRRRAYAECLWR